MDLIKPPGALRRLSVVDELAGALRVAILDRALEPGEAIPEEVVAANYDVSRPTARSAITLLTVEGLLQREPSRTAVVPRLTSEDVRDLFRVRRPIELEAVRLITRKGLPVPRAAYAAVVALRGLPASARTHEVVTANIGFHRALVEGVNNAPLVRCFSALEGAVKLALAQSGVDQHAADAADQHEVLLRVLEQHDWEPARQEMLDHLRRSGAHIVQALEGQGLS